MKNATFSTTLVFLLACTATGQVPTADEKLLKAAGIATDGPGLLEYFRKQTGLIPQKEPPARIMAAARLLVERKPPGASGVLWTYFPYCENAAVEKEVLPAALFLENGDGKQAVPALIMSLKHPLVGVRLRSASALTWLGWDADGAVAALAAALEDDAPEVRRQALFALEGVGPAAAEAAPTLIKLLKHEDEKIRRQVHLLLGRVGAGQKGVLIALQERLLDPNNKQQLWAAQALEEIGAESIPILLEALGRGPEKYSRSFSAQRLCWLARGKLEVLPDLLAHFAHEEVGAWTAAGLPYFGPRAIPAIAEFLDHPSVNIRIRAAKCLGQFGPFAKDAVPKLRAALKDKESAVCAQAAIALWTVERNTDVVLPVVLDALKNDSDLFRPREICSILEQMEPLPKTGLTALLDILKQPANRFHFDAVRALTVREMDAKEVAPVLIEVLQKDKDFFPRAWAAKALRYLGPASPEVIPALAKALNDPRLTVRIEAIKALASVGPKAKTVLPALMDALKDKYYGGDVALIIGKLGREAKEAVPALIQALEKHPQKAAMALGFLGPHAKDAIPDLIRTLKNPVNQASMDALAHIGAEAIPPLIEALGDKNAQVSFQAAQTLGKMGPPAVASLRKVLADPRGFRWGAAMALGLIGPEAKLAVPDLVKALADKEGALKRGAARALGEIGIDSPAVIKALTGVIEDGNCAYQALQSLAQFGPQAKAAGSALRGVLKKNKIHLGAAEALAKIDPQAKEPAAVFALAMKDPKYRWVAVKDARRIGLTGKEIIAALPQTLDDKNYLIVQEAVAYLGEISVRNEDAIPALIAAASHRTHWVRLKAIAALGTIGPRAKAAIPQLIRAMGDRSDLIRLEAAKVLAQLGPAAKEAVPALRASLQRHDPLVRPFAAEALLRIAGPSDAVTLALVAAFRSHGLANAIRIKETRQKAAEVLAELGPLAKDALADLYAAAHDSGGSNTAHIEIRPHAAYALWKVTGQTDDAVASLMQSLKVCQGPGKVKAAKVLGAIGPPARNALPTLRLVLRDCNRGETTDAEIRSAVAAAIKRIE